MRRFLAIVALATLAACDSFDPLTDSTVTGTWRGSTASNQAFVVVLQQGSGSIVAGNGTVTAAGASRNLSVSGTFNSPTFAGTLTPTGASAITYTATVEGGNSMVGVLTGGGFNGEGLALLRDQ